MNYSFNYVMNGVKRKGADLSIRVHGKPENETRMLYLEEVHTKGANINLMVEHQGVVFFQTILVNKLFRNPFSRKEISFSGFFFF